MLWSTKALIGGTPPGGTFFRKNSCEPFLGSMERSSNVVEADMLVVVNDTDLITNPGPSRLKKPRSQGSIYESAALVKKGERK